MNTTAKILHSAGFIALCAPSALLLLLGLVFSPAFLLASLTGDSDKFAALLLVIGGVWGMFSLGRMFLQTVFIQHYDFELPVYGLAAGTLAAIFPFFYLPDLGLFSLVLFGPILAMAYLLFLQLR